MTTSGGVLIYGVHEDEHGRPTDLTPLPLSNLPERIEQIAQSGIHEPPTISIKTLVKDQEANTGYLIVEVPKSPRAPHMVQLKGDYRFYGRGATGNRILTEDEVARLYRQRADWQHDAHQLLEDAIEASPFKPGDWPGLLFLIASPIGADRDVLRRTHGSTTQRQEPHPLELILNLHSNDDWDGPKTGYPEVRRHGQYWKIDLGRASDQPKPEESYAIKVFDDGRVTLFFGLNISMSQDLGSILFIDYIAATAERFLRLAKILYQQAGFNGAVDTAIALTGIEGAIANIHASPDFAHARRAYPDKEYRRTHRFLVMEMAEDSHKAAHDLLDNFCRALLGGPYERLLKRAG